ncbi:MAG: CoA-binding protein [Nanoarchaeota archaeon]
MPQLDYFFNPKSIAIIGASRNPIKIGHVVFRNFLEGKYEGKLFPINPKAEELFGLKAFPSILNVKEKIDLAVITVPAAITAKVLEECGRKGVPAVIIITAGFKEIGNVKEEDELKKILSKYKMRCIGVNCLGVYDPYSNVDTFFLPRYKLRRPEAGSISFISQSGALGSVVMDWMATKGYKISKFISYGNATDVDEADLIEYLGEDKKTSVICAYLEGVNNGRKFFDASKKVSKKKPIIALKGGVTKEGSNSASSHTGSLAGSAEVVHAAFKQAGVIIANDLEQVFNFARVLSTQPLTKGNRIQIITDGGGFGVLATDCVIKNEMRLAKMQKTSLDKIKKVSPPYVVLKNPIDLTGDADTERYRVALEAALADPNVDMIALIVLFQVPALSTDVVDVISEVSRKSKKPIIVISAGGGYTEVLKKSLEENDIPCFSYPESAIESMKALYNYSKNKKG